MKKIKDLFKQLTEYRRGLYCKAMLLKEKPDKRYPKSFIDGMIAGYNDSINSIDALLSMFEKEKDE